MLRQKLKSSPTQLWTCSFQSHRLWIDKLDVSLKDQIFKKGCEGIPWKSTGLDLALSQLQPGLGSIPGQGTKIPQAVWYGQKKPKKRLWNGPIWLSHFNFILKKIILFFRGSPIGKKKKKRKKKGHPYINILMLLIGKKECGNSYRF